MSRRLPALTKRPSRAGRASSRTRRAFTLVELMVSVTIISLLAAAAVPAVQNVKRRSIATAIGNDFRVFAAALDTYAHETGGWPAEVDAGVLPPEMAARFNAVAWQRPTPLGGQYNWDNFQTHQGVKYRAAIAISSTSSSAVIQDLDILETLDRVIDDGNLATGNFRLGADDEPVFIVAIQ